MIWSVPGYLVDVPDIRLFPAAFNAGSVTFRAGLELSIMNRALGALAAIRGIRDVALPGWALVVVRHIANALRPFGTDRGGMQVRVIGQTQYGPVERTWTLIAEAGQGPFVPGIVARALLRRAGQIAPGARPCLSEVTLQEIEDAMSDLSIITETREQPCPTLFQTALGDSWQLLPPEMQALHLVQDVESFSGKAEVTRGDIAARPLGGMVFRVSGRWQGRAGYCDQDQNRPRRALGKNVRQSDVSVPMFTITPAASLP